METDLDEEYQARLAALRAEIQLGIDDFDNGRHSSKEEVLEQLRSARRVKRREDPHLGEGRAGP